LTAISTATPAMLDEIMRKAARAAAEGAISEDAFSAACEAVQARRQAGRSQGLGTANARPESTRRPHGAHRPSIPDRVHNNHERCLVVARAGLVVPNVVLAQLRPIEVSVAVAIAELGGARGCKVPVARLAAHARVSCRSVQYAVTRFEALGLIRVDRSRLRAFVSDFNVITIVSADWLDWMARRPRTSRVHGVPRMPGKFISSTANGSPVAPEGASIGRPGPAAGQVLRPPRPPARV
jgi:hypothetical protein